MDVLSDLTFTRSTSITSVVEFITSAKNFYRYRIEDYRLGFISLITSSIYHGLLHQKICTGISHLGKIL